MTRLDAHQHFWHYHPAEHVWMTDDMEILRQDYLPSEFHAIMRSSGFDGTVAVQARQSLEETRWLLGLAARHPLIRGVVGWVDLRSREARDQLDEFGGDPKFVGVRHVVHDEPDDRFMLRSEFRRGIALLREFGLTYDLLLFPRHLPVAAELAREFPGQAFVLDHLAKPAIREGKLLPWERDLRALAACPNVSCKLSGLVTETKWRGWQAEEFAPYLAVALDAFGPERLMIGSDWPVCTLAGDYQSVMDIVINYVAALPAAEQDAILGGNCARIYGIDTLEGHAPSCP